MKKPMDPSRRITVGLVWAMLSAALIPILCGWVFYSRSSGIIADQEKQMNEQSLRIVLQRMGDTIDQITSHCVRLAYRFRSIHFPPLEDFAACDRLNIHDAVGLLETVRAELPLIADEAYLFIPQSGYAVTTTGYAEDDLLYKTYYKPFGITRQEFDALHSRICCGELVPVGKYRTAYLMTGTPGAVTEFPNQLVLLINIRHLYSCIQPFLLDNREYSLTNSQGEELFRYGGQVEKAGGMETYAAADRGYRLTVTIPSSSAGYRTQGVRILYLCTLAAALLLSGGILFGMTRQTVVPIGQIIRLIQRHFDEDEGQDTGDLQQIAEMVNRMALQRAAHEDELKDLRERVARQRLRAVLTGRMQSEKDAEYIIATFPTVSAENAELFGRALRASVKPPYAADTVEMEQGLCLVLTRTAGELRSEDAAGVLRSVMHKIKESGNLPCACACGISTVHHTYGTAETACRESRISADCLPFYPATPVLSFESIQYQPEYFMRDWHHLDKQLLFAADLSKGNYPAARRTLDKLFPEEYLQAESCTSVSLLHLYSLKYQFLHDVNTAISSQKNCFEAFGRIFVRDVLSSRNHRELLLIMHHMLEQLSALESSAKLDGESDETIRKICSYIRAHYGDHQLSVGYIADRLHLQPNSLTKLFSRKYGLGMAQYIRNVRMENARELLCAGVDRPIHEVAGMCGYVSTLTFSRAFKQQYGVTPGEYRTRHGRILKTERIDCLNDLSESRENRETETFSP